MTQAEKNEYFIRAQRNEQAERVRLARQRDTRMREMPVHNETNETNETIPLAKFKNGDEVQIKSNIKSGWGTGPVITKFKGYLDKQTAEGRKIIGMIHNPPKGIHWVQFLGE